MGDMGNATRMWALDAPSCTLDASMIYVGGSGEVWMPLPAYLIEHPKGLVLFDTGLDPVAAGDPSAIYGEFADAVRLRFTQDQRVDRQIEQLGYKVEDITHVVLSHLHYDHAGALRLFSDARLYIGAGEFAYAFSPDPMQAAFYRRQEFDGLQNRNWFEIPGVDHDIFGDGSLTVISTPGHTPGGLSLVVRLPGRNFVLSGDAVHARAAFENLLPSPYDMNAHQTVQSLKRLRLLEQSADATLWIGHEGLDWSEFGAPSCFE